MLRSCSHECCDCASATCRARSGAFDEDGHGLGDIDAQQLESLKFEREVSKHNVAVGAVARAVSNMHVHGLEARCNTFAVLDCSTQLCHLPVVGLTSAAKLALRLQQLVVERQAARPSTVSNLPARMGLLVVCDGSCVLW